MSDKDHEIVQEVLRGQTDAFGELIQRHQEGLMRLCLTRLKNLARAQEAVQEAFLKAYLSLSNYRIEASFKSWIYRIAINYCNDLLRKDKIKKLFLFSFRPEEKSHSNPQEAETLLRNQSLIQRALGSLSQDYRQILTLREWEEFSYEELAQTLKISLDGVKAKLSRARKALAQKVEEMNHEKM